jgi:O-antigen/teichoic acid export membrane protein
VQLRKAISKYASSASVKSVATVITGNLATSLISLITSIFVARWTDPYNMGLWNLVLLVSIYAPILQLGVFNGLNRQLPYFMGKGEKQTSLNMAEASYAWCLLLTVASAVITVVVASWYRYSGQLMYSYTTIAIGFIVVSSWLSQYLTVTYRTSAEFGRLAKKNTLVALVSVPFTLLVLAFGYVGLMARAALIAIFGVAALYFRRPIQVLPKWNKPILFQLVRVGMPIWFVGQLGTFFLTLDRLVLADSPIQLGYFSISLQASAFASMVPIAISMVLYPQMVQKYGETNNADAAWQIAKKGAIVTTALGALVAIVGWILIPIFVQILLPAYMPGAAAAQWASLTGLVMGLSVFNNIFNVIQRQGVYLANMAIGVVFFFGTWFFLTNISVQAALTSAVQSMLVANLMMSISSMITSKAICVLHDRNVKNDESGCS